MQFNLLFRFNYQIPYTTSYFFLIYEDFKSFEFNFNVIVNLKTFEYQAVFIIYIHEKKADTKAFAKNIFDVLFRNYVYYALVALPLPNNDIVAYNLNFFYPSHKYCYKDPLINELDICKNGTWIRNQFLNSTFPSLPNMYNCSLDILTMTYPPFVINATDGFEIDILELLEDIFNFTFDITVDRKATGWGDKVNGTWYGKLKTIKDNYIFGIGNLVVDEAIGEDFSYTQDYFVQRAHWITPIPKLMPRYKVIFIIFKGYLWLLIIITYFIFVLLFHVLSFSKYELRKYKEYGNIFIYTFGLYICAAIGTQPKSTIVRYLFASAVLLSFLLSSFYQTLLINFLTHDHYESSYDYSVEVLESNLKIGGLQQYRTVFEGRNSTTYNEVLSKYENFTDDRDSIDYWLNKVANDRDTATVLNSFFTRYAIAIQNPAVTRPNGEPKIHLGSTELYTFPNKIVSSKNNLFLKLFDRIIGILVTHGFIVKWTAYYLQELEKAEFILKWNSEKTGQSIVFTFDHVEGAFFLLIIGYSTAFAAFLGECAYNRYLNQKKMHKAIKKQMRKELLKSLQKYDSNKNH